MEHLIHFITHLGVPAIVFTVFAESGLLIGFFLPGDSLLFASGAFVRQGILNIDVNLFIFLLFIAAVLGDGVGYYFGSKVGRKLFNKPDARFFKKKYLKQTEEFYKKHGAKTIVLARFVPIVRTFAPIVAGVSEMKYSTFLFYNVFGAAIWTTSFVYLGYFAGEFIEKLGINLEVAVILIIALSLLPMVIEVLSKKDNRDALKAKIKKLASKNKK